MSEHLVHVAVMEDCFNILLQTQRVCSDFKKVIDVHRGFGEAASTTMSGDSYTVMILEDLRNRWEGRTPDDMLESKLAFVLGWVRHRAADRQMKPVFRALNTHESKKIVKNECTLYDEAKVYTEYYLNREHDPYKNVMHLMLNGAQAYPQVDLEGMKNLFNGMLRSSFMRMHTMKPDLKYTVTEIENWIDNIYTLLQHFDIRTDMIAQIIAKPDPEKYKRYIVDANFFNDHDPLIIVAKKLRFKNNYSESEVDVAINASQSSDYANALKTALQYTIACNDFFIRKIEEKELRKYLQIGVPGVDGKSV